MAAVDPRARRAASAAPRTQVAPPEPAGAGLLRRLLDAEDLLGGRLLALAGGAAVVLAAAFFVTLAAERGWFGPPARVTLATAASAALVAAGAWLYERRGGTQASLATVGAGVAGLYLSLVAAAPLYGLLPAGVALLAAACVAALATSLAMRWSAQPIAGLGIVGGLLAPVITGAGESAGTLAFLGLAHAAACAVLVARRWNWLGAVAFTVTMPQVGFWVLDGGQPANIAAGLAGFGLLNLVAAVGFALRDPARRLPPVAALLIGLDALWLVALGAVAFDEPGWWLWAVAAIHAAAGAGLGTVLWVGQRRPPHRRAAGPVLRVPVVVAVLLVGNAWLYVFGANPPRGEDLLIALVAFGSATFACARLADRGEPVDWPAADAGALLLLVTANLLTLGGMTLTLLWAATSVLLNWTDARSSNARGTGNAAAVGAAALLGLAALRVLDNQVPFAALMDGVASLPAAAGAIGVLVAAALACAALSSPGTRRAGWLTAAAVAVLYLGSVTVVTLLLRAPAQPGWGLDAQQRAQVALSTYWSVCGATAVWLGLRARRQPTRVVGFALLSLAVAKVALHDLGVLDSGYRVVSLLALGLLLLAAAFGYQRLRAAGGVAAATPPRPSGGHPAPVRRR